MSAADVVGRPLTDFVAPEYVELVENNLRRRLAGESAAERYEIELVGRARPGDARGAVEHRDRQRRRAGAAADRAGNAARAPSRADVSQKPRAMVTLDAMGESVITVDAEGRIDYINHSAETASRPAASIRSWARLSRRSHRWSMRTTAARSAIRCARRWHRRPRHHGPARGAGAGERRRSSARSRSASRRCSFDGKDIARGWCWCCTTPASCAA